MIEIALDLYGAEVEFKTGDSSMVTNQGKFRLITSLMTLQFIENPDQTIKTLASALEDDGLMVLSVFNPDYARNAYEAKQEFFGFDFSKTPTSGTLEMVREDKVPTFIRDADFYEYIAEQAGMTLVAKAYPPFTSDFLKQYPHPVPTKDPEYMVLGFK
jgi:2-polyprenyl-3-methyl-5-hydroxy-6-metoxy-1,4-benzoquinol methylase